MSCGCGGRATMPVSVALRLRAAELVGGDVDRAKKVYEFLIEGHTAEQLDASAAKPETGATGKNDTTTRWSRNSMLLEFGPTVETQVVAIGTLAQMQAAVALEKYGPVSADKIQQHLRARGLRFGMSAEDIKIWIDTGRS